MKKIVLTVVAMLTFTMASAENENMNATNAYVMDVNMNSLARALSNDQFEAVKDIHATFCTEMLNAATADRADRVRLTKEAVKHDLKNLAAVLDRQQMRTYIGILNTTFNNRGISIVE